MSAAIGLAHLTERDVDDLRLRLGSRIQALGGWNLTRPTGIARPAARGAGGILHAIGTGSGIGLKFLIGLRFALIGGKGIRYLVDRFPLASPSTAAAPPSLLFRRRLLLVSLIIPRSVFLGLLGRVQQVEVLELIACGYKGLRGLLLAHSDDGHTAFAQARDKPREIGIGAHDRESVDGARIQDIHGIDDHRRIGRVLTVRVAVLLHRDDRIIQQATLPAREARTRPVAVDALVRRGAGVGDFLQNDLDVLLGDVVGIDKDGEPEVRIERGGHKPPLH